jgi:hypothetical protein
MSVERKNPLKRDQALNDATSGQIGENVKRLTIPKIFWMADTRFEQFTNSR